jgi:hypothetical protein
MKLKLDENLPTEIDLHLQDGGHDAETGFDNRPCMWERHRGTSSCLILSGY